MEITDFLTPDRVVVNVRVRDKGQLLAEAARLLGHAAPALAPKEIESALMARETLGSTGLGGGFALPHARIEGLDHYRGLFLRLGRAIDFDAIDGKPVDLVFVLLIPVNSTTPHVSALAAISRRFRDAALVAKVRKADNETGIFSLLTAG